MKKGGYKYIITGKNKKTNSFTKKNSTKKNKSKITHSKSMKRNKLSISSILFPYSMNK